MRKSQATVKLMLKRDNIYLVVTFKCKRVLKSTGVKCPSSKWDSNKELISRASPRQMKSHPLLTDFIDNKKCPVSY